MPQPDVFTAAFGRAISYDDPDFAIKFSVSSLVESTSLWDSYSELMADEGHLAGIGGDPGWELERIPPSSDGSERIRASLPPESGLDLRYPEQDYDIQTFLSFLRRAVEAYKTHFPGRPVPNWNLGEESGAE